MQHGLVPEELGGEVQTVEVSAKEKLNLDKLEESILLQAEILELKANPDRPGTGTVIANGVSIGDDAVLGIGSCITRDVTAGSSVIGNPMRVLDRPLRVE